MKNDVIYIIGDKYKEFSLNQNVLTYSDAIAYTNVFQGKKNKKTYYRIGQGVSNKEFSYLCEHIKQNRLEKYFDIQNKNIIKTKENKLNVHKKKEENIMITRPIKLSDTDYVSHLVIDDDCAESSDHLTGQHIQGMVLMEAARQMMLAVTEIYYYGENKEEALYFVLNKVNTSFMKFTFPVDVSLNYKIISLQKKSNNALKSTCLISILQFDDLVTEVEIEFSVYASEFISRLERNMAIETLNKAVAEEPVRKVSCT